MKRGQSSFEFTILVGFLMLSFTIFFLAIQDNLSEKLEERDDMRVKEIALTVQLEIDLAHESMEGYSRTFRLPTEIYGKDYDISINESLVFVKTNAGKSQISLPVQEVNGNIIKFTNKIEKENGEVKLNQ